MLVLNRLVLLDKIKLATNMHGFLSRSSSRFSETVDVAK